MVFLKSQDQTGQLQDGWDLPSFEKCFFTASDGVWPPVLDHRQGAASAAPRRRVGNRDHKPLPPRSQIHGETQVCLSKVEMVVYWSIVAGLTGRAGLCSWWDWDGGWGIYLPSLISQCCHVRAELWGEGGTPTYFWGSPEFLPVETAPFSGVVGVQGILVGQDSSS